MCCQGENIEIKHSYRATIKSCCFHKFWILFQKDNSHQYYFCHICICNTPSRNSSYRKSKVFCMYGTVALQSPIHFGQLFKTGELQICSSTESTGLCLPVPILNFSYTFPLNLINVLFVWYFSNNSKVMLNEVILYQSTTNKALYV